jgi:hypothetical protein
MSDPVLDNEITVPESSRDVDTQMEIQYNDRLVFTAYGEIWAGVWFTGRNDPQGWDSIDYNSKFPLPETIHIACSADWMGVTSTS